MTPHIRNLLVVAIGLAIAGAGCGDGDDVAEPVPADFSLVLERSICFGPCPVYRVDTDASGKVRYQGEYFVRRRGAREGQVGQPEIRKILLVLRQAGFFDIEDEYWYWGPGCEQLVSDAPTVTISVTRSGVSHRVRHYHGCFGDPVLERLTELELELDEILGTAEWVFCSEQDSFFETSCDQDLANKALQPPRAAGPNGQREPARVGRRG